MGFIKLPLPWCSLSVALFSQCALLPVAFISPNVNGRCSRNISRLIYQSLFTIYVYLKALSLTVAYKLSAQAALTTQSACGYRPAECCIRIRTGSVECCEFPIVLYCMSPLSLLCPHRPARKHEPSEYQNSYYWTRETLGLTCFPRTNCCLLRFKFCIILFPAVASSHVNEFLPIIASEVNHYFMF